MLVETPPQKKTSQQLRYVSYREIKNNAGEATIYIFNVLGTRSRVRASKSSLNDRKQDPALSFEDFYFFCSTLILLFIAALANGLPHPGRGALPQSLRDCIIPFHLQRRGDGMIKQRPRRYLWLLLT